MPDEWRSQDAYDLYQREVSSHNLEFVQHWCMAENNICAECRLPSNHAVAHAWAKQLRKRRLLRVSILRFDFDYVHVDQASSWLNSSPKKRSEFRVSPKQTCQE